MNHFRDILVKEELAKCTTKVGKRAILNKLNEEFPNASVWDWYRIATNQKTVPTSSLLNTIVHVTTELAGKIPFPSGLKRRVIFGYRNLIISNTSPKALKTLDSELNNIKITQKDYEELYNSTWFLESQVPLWVHRALLSAVIKGEA